MPIDFSSLLVLVEPESGVAQAVCHFPENAKYRHYGLVMDTLAGEGHEDETDLGLPMVYANAYVPVHLALNFNQSPKDASKGFVFGSDPETCDVVLSMNKNTGISSNHFSIGVDWATGNPLITCLTSDEGGTGIRIQSGSRWELYLRNAWKVLDHGTTSAIKISAHLQFLVYAPSRRNREPTYSDNVRNFFQDCQNAVPEMTHLKLYDPEPTPLLVSRSRGLSGMEYFTTRTIFGEKVVLCEAKSHQNVLGDLETFIIKRFRNVSDEWPNHAKTVLRKLWNLRHRHIIAPEDIITDTMEYMPVYLLKPPETLADRHIRESVTEIDAIQILAQVFEGLKFLHANGIVHGGLYPGSIRIKRSAPWSISLSDIGLQSYVDLENPKERGYYASQPTPDISEPMPKHDTWSAGVVGLYIILPGGLPPRPKRFPYDQSAWTVFMAARAKSFHASLKPGCKKEGARFLTRVLKHGYRERLTAEECLQDLWIWLWQVPIPDSPGPSDPFSYIPDGDVSLKTLGEVEDDEGSGEDTEIGDPRTITSNGKQPQRSRDKRVPPSITLHQQRNTTPRSLECPGVIPTHSPHTSVTPASSSNQQRSATPRGLRYSGVTFTKSRYRKSKPSDSISRRTSGPPSDSAIRGEHTPKSGRGRDPPRKVRDPAGQMIHGKDTAADDA